VRSKLFSGRRRGRSGIHTHCTNTRITDPEILERRYPVLLRQFSLREGSGGKGRYRGGDGVIREIEALRPLTMSILSERRVLHPYGIAGGEDGKCGRNFVIKKNGEDVGSAAYSCKRIKEYYTVMTLTIFSCFVHLRDCIIRWRQMQHNY
jgi:N-methylhydantoinase B/oxoprolinase/acetone carboxylase alpha subunit